MEDTESYGRKLARVPVTEHGLLGGGGLLEGSTRGQQLSLTASPTGRFAANAFERTMLRALDPYNNIDYIAGRAPDNDRNMKEASWLASQAFVESLRAYPVKAPTTPSARLDSPSKAMIVHEDVQNPGILFNRYTFSGNTYSRSTPPLEHVETAVRRRCGIATRDAEWRVEQLPRVWTHTRTMTNHDWGPFETVSTYRQPDRLMHGQK